jgi:multicomponent Na+:H+ antiporter subunit B
VQVKLPLRLAVFFAGALGLGFLLAWGVLDLPAFGHYAGPYGDIITKVVEPQRHMANAVTALVFDYRGFDTMGEELILFAAASAVAMLLREIKERDTVDVVDAIRSDAINGVGILGSIATMLLALYVVAHGFISPGGGFQGGVVIAAAFLFVFLTAEYHAYARIAPTKFAEPLESFGAGAYVALGLIAFGFGLAFLENFLPLGVTGRLRSAGSAALVNWASALAVAGGFLLIFSEYLEETMAARYRRNRP